MKLQRNEDRLGMVINEHDFYQDSDVRIQDSVDITQKCPSRVGGKERVILDYVQVTDGISVRVVLCNPDQDVGRTFFKYLKDMEDVDALGMCHFRNAADELGLSVEELVLIVKSAAPALDREKQVADFKKYSHEWDTLFEPRLKNAGLSMSDLNR